MIEQDTVKLLRECDAGIKMGVSSIDDVLGCVRSNTFKRCLESCKNEHEKLKKEIQDYVKKHTAPYKYPRLVVFRDELPKTTSGKIIRSRL